MVSFRDLSAKSDRAKHPFRLAWGVSAEYGG